MKDYFYAYLQGNQYGLKVNWRNKSKDAFISFGLHVALECNSETLLLFFLVLRGYMRLSL